MMKWMMSRLVNKSSTNNTRDVLKLTYSCSVYMSVNISIRTIRRLNLIRLVLLAAAFKDDSITRELEAAYEDNQFTG